MFGPLVVAQGFASPELLRSRVCRTLKFLVDQNDPLKKGDLAGSGPLDAAKPDFLKRSRKLASKVRLEGRQEKFF